MTPESVTDAAGRQLHRIEQNEPISMVARKGGAIWRLLERLEAAKWIKGPPPYELTELGMAALKRYQHRCVEREGRYLRKGGLR